ncbi:MAG: hypothetical protein QN144_08895 [Armatimonadota bacterium]|nr:hypothetical protein [Armatimonadota bacterium]
MKQQVDELVERLRAHFTQRRPASLLAAFLFGSHPAGQAGRESDAGGRPAPFPGASRENRAPLPGAMSRLHLRLDEGRVLAALGEREPVEEFLSLVAGRLQA